MEQGPEIEKVSHLSLDTYLEFIAGLNTLDGKLIEDKTHAFYVWVTNTYPSFQNIDGVSLLSLYEKNVLENDMTQDRFRQYCINHGFPTPYIDSEEDIAGYMYLKPFMLYITNAQDQKEEEYKEWAKENGVDTFYGAVMIFFDLEGNKYKVRTDFEHHGEIIAD